MPLGDMIVWVDLKHATLYRLKPGEAPMTKFDSSRIELGREAISIYDQIARALKDSARVLIVGPGVAKYHLLSRLRENFPLVAKKVSGCETIEHLSDGEIVAYGRKYWPVKSTA